jgi:replicative DNA helicase
MAPTLEQRLVNKALEGGDSIKAVLTRGVTRDWFFNSEDGDAIQLILDHYADYGMVPTEITFATHMGKAYKLFTVSESVEYLIDQMARSQRLDVTRRALFDAEDELKAGKVEDAMNVLRTALLEAEGFSPRSSPLVDSMENTRVKERWDSFKKRGASGSPLLGYSTGFPTIDAATLGLQNGHLVTLVAQSKVGKTSISLAVANHIYEVHKKRILFVSFEMSIRELEMRQEALMAQVNLQHLQTGRLSPAENKRYRAYLDKVETDFDWSFWFVDAAAGSTVSAVQALIDQYSPDVVFIDGIYMMRDEQTKEMNTPQALTNITRGLKRMASAVDKPVFINTQALAWKSKGVKITADSIGYSSSFLQDSDVVLGLERIKLAKGEDEETHSTERVLRVLASRNSGLATADIEFNYTDGIIAESGSVAA